MSAQDGYERIQRVKDENNRAIQRNIDRLVAMGYAEDHPDIVHLRNCIESSDHGGYVCTGQAALAIVDENGNETEYRSKNLILDAALLWSLQRMGEIDGTTLTSAIMGRISLADGTTPVQADDTALSGSTTLHKDIDSSTITDGVLKLEAAVDDNEGNFTATEMGLWVYDGTTYTLIHHVLIPAATKLNTLSGYLRWYITMGRSRV